MEDSVFEEGLLPGPFYLHPGSLEASDGLLVEGGDVGEDFLGSPSLHLLEALEQEHRGDTQSTLPGADMDLPDGTGDRHERREEILRTEVHGAFRGSVGLAGRGTVINDERIDGGVGNEVRDLGRGKGNHHFMHLVVRFGGFWDSFMHLCTPRAGKAPHPRMLTVHIYTTGELVRLS